MFADVLDPSWVEKVGYPIAQNIFYLYAFYWLAQNVFVPMKDAHIKNIQEQTETNKKIVNTQEIAIATQQKMCDGLEFVKTHVSRINCPPACLHSCPVEKKVPAQ